MPQSLSRILIHLVFSTKNRERILSPAIQAELHPYLATILDNLDCPSESGVSKITFIYFLASPAPAPSPSWWKR